MDQSSLQPLSPAPINPIMGTALENSPQIPTQTLSLLDMFWHAEPIIQLIMLGLLAASFWSWTIIFQKVMRLRQLNAAADQFEEAFWSGGPLDDLYDRLSNRYQDPLSAVFCSAMKEWRRTMSRSTGRPDSRGTVQQRIDRVMHLVISREMTLLERYLGFLSSTASTAPFVGVFGTVLGIMNSFQAIAGQQNTTLAVVAPGIAEALLATAIGLIAAIPAMIAYNKISADMDRYATRLEAFATEFNSIISRQLEEEAA